MYKSSILFIIVAIWVSFYSIRTTTAETNDEFKLIKTTHGVIRGKVATTLFKQRKYYSFRGIPYARPPVGSLRFKVLSVLWQILFIMPNGDRIKVRSNYRRPSRQNRGLASLTLWNTLHSAYRKNKRTCLIMGLPQTLVQTMYLAPKTVYTWIFLYQVMNKTRQIRNLIISFSIVRRKYSAGEVSGDIRCSRWCI